MRIEGAAVPVGGPGRYRVEVATDVPATSRAWCIGHLHGLYHLKTDLTVRRSVLRQTPNYLIDVPARPAS